MKITVTEIREVEVNLPFPHYRKNSVSFIKVLGENSELQVSTHDFCLGIKTNKHNLSYSVHGFAESTEEEFNEAFKLATEKLNKLAL